MSVVTVIVQPDNYVVLACDGVASHPTTGAVVGYASKITLLPDLDAAMGVTGIFGLAQIMQFNLPLHVSNFDGLLEVLPELMENSCDQISAALGDECGKCCVVVTGWSPAREKYEGWRITNYEKKGRLAGADEETEILHPFELRQLDPCTMWASAGPGAALLRKFGVLDGPKEDTDLEVVQRMVCAARAHSGESCEQYDHFNAGGFLQTAIVQRGCVQSAIQYRWPEDMIGDPIDPARGQPMPDHLMAHYNAQA